MLRKPFLCLSLLGLLSGAATSLPEGPSVVHGQVQIQGQGATMTVQQMTNQAIVNWGSFNIRPEELVRFMQPGQAAAILNRVTGMDPSVIQGALQANGRVFLVNPNGVLIGPGAIIDAGSFVASTLNMSNEDFLSNKLSFVQDPDKALAAIVNQGTIRVSDGGFVVLASPLIHQDGLIVANQGQVALAAGQQTTVNLDNQGLLEVAVKGGFQQGQPASGQERGTVLLTQGQVSDLLTQVVTQPGVLEASSLNGLEAQGAEGVIVHSGRTEAAGGKVVMNSSQATLLTPTSQLEANGGDIRALSGGRTLAMGSIQARDGGFLEVSGPTVSLLTTPEVDNFLLDPAVINLVNASTPPPQAGDTGLPNIGPGFMPGATVNVSLSALASQVSNITLQADQDINWLGNNETLTLSPGVDISFIATNGNINMSSSNHLISDGSQRYQAGGSLIRLPRITSNNGQVTVISTNSANQILLQAPIDAMGAVSLSTAGSVGSIFNQNQPLLISNTGVNISAQTVFGSGNSNTNHVLIINAPQATVNVTGPNIPESPVPPGVPGNLSALIENRHPGPTPFTTNSSSSTATIFYRDTQTGGFVDRTNTGGGSGTNTSTNTSGGSSSTSNSASSLASSIIGSSNNQSSTSSSSSGVAPGLGGSTGVTGNGQLQQQSSSSGDSTHGGSTEGTGQPNPGGGTQFTEPVEVRPQDEVQEQEQRATNTVFRPETATLITLQQTHESRDQLAHSNTGLVGFQYVSPFSFITNLIVYTELEEDPQFWRQFLEEFIIWEADAF